MSQVTHNTDGTEEDAFYGYNPRTDVETMTDESGDTVSTYGYTAYGKNDTDEFTGVDKPDAGTPGEEPYNMYRYNAKRWDSGSGTYDMGFRDYDPGLNRFLTRDNYNGALADLNLQTSPWTSNRYAFTGGNPTTFIEIDGHRPQAGGSIGGGNAGGTCNTWYAGCEPVGNDDDTAEIGRPLGSSADTSDPWIDGFSKINNDYGMLTGAYINYWSGERRYYDRHAGRYQRIIASGGSHGRSQIQLDRMTSRAGNASSMASKLRLVGPLSAVASGLYSAADQAHKDANDPSLSTGDRVGRAVVRGALVAGGGALVGGGAAAVCGALSGGLLAVGCGAVGAQLGAAAGNWVADQAMPYVDDAIDLGGEILNKGRSAAGDAVAFLNPFD